MDEPNCAVQQILYLGIKSCKDFNTNYRTFERMIYCTASISRFLNTRSFHNLSESLPSMNLVGTDPVYPFWQKCENLQKYAKNQNMTANRPRIALRFSRAWSFWKGYILSFLTRPSSLKSDQHKVDRRPCFDSKISFFIIAYSHAIRLHSMALRLQCHSVKNCTVCLNNMFYNPCLYDWFQFI